MVYRTTLSYATCVCAVWLAGVLVVGTVVGEDAAFMKGTVDVELAGRVALHHVQRFQAPDEYTPGVPRAFSDPDTGTILYYLIDLQPRGYVVVSGSTALPPIIAYSFECSAGDCGEQNPLHDLLLADLHLRLANISVLPAELVRQRQADWARQAEPYAPEGDERGFEQWPPAGSSDTGGWIQTRWTQSAPYNNLCPIDPVSGSRSLAGCPAVAMAQILNYQARLNGTRFDDADDYYHNYAGRRYWIDDDYLARGFPAFPQLNTYLDTLFDKYFHGTPLSNTDKAALVFACGTAATQVYTSSGSGTFGVSQALAAFERFGCGTAELLYAESPGPYERLAQNMMDGYPAHLACVNAAWNSGHNLVVDGYNTDTYYHLNFGWGGSYDGWYLLPSELPFELTVIEGIIVDIMIDACPAMDCNCDGGIDLVDYAYLEECLTGPSVPVGAPGCVAFDGEPDDDVDLVDFALFQTTFGG